MPKESVIKHYSSGTTGSVPSAGDLIAGELAINTADEKIFFKNLAGSVIDIGSSKGISGVYAKTTSIGNGTLTLKVSGTGLAGSQTFTANQSGNATFTVTSNATNANTGSTIVARDASGDFSAGTISAALNGNASTATSAATLTTARNINGTSFNGGADITTTNWGTTRNITIGDSTVSVNGSTNYTWTAVGIGATSTNTANKIVMRDASGNFSAGTITATLNGNASTATTATSATTATTATSANTLTTARKINGTDFNGSAAITTLNWGTGRTITIGDTGKSVNGSENVTWTAVEIGATSSNTANKIVMRDASGDFYANTVTLNNISAAGLSPVTFADALRFTYWGIPTDYYTTLSVGNNTANRSIGLPNESGEIALRGANTFAGNQTVQGSLTVTNGITFGSGTTTMVFIPKTSADSGGLWIRGGNFQVGGSSFGANQGAFNFNPNSEVHSMLGNFTINTNESYQAAQNTLTLNTSSAHTGRPLRISRGTNNFIAGCEPNGTWFGTGIKEATKGGLTCDANPLRMPGLGMEWSYLQSMAGNFITVFAKDDPATITFDNMKVVADEGVGIGAGAINAQTTAYTLAAGDNGKVITINSASAVNLTVGTAVGTTGFSCSVIQLGAGQVTIAASGTTLNSYNGLKIAGQHGAASIVCYATNVFNVAGNLTT